MKYGILGHIGFSKKEENHNRLMSMGDIFECLAILRIYERMGIKKEDLLTCYPYELDVYQDEYVVLPINVYALNVDYSRRILPVFLGLALGGEHDISKKNINMLRRFAPVGCRDERTMRRLLEKGIDAYVQGCLVATFPEREQNLETQNKVFFVDPQAGIKDYIPKSLLENYEFYSHDFYMTPEEMLKGKDIYEYGVETIERYKKEAKLIVTSKYHAAVIALALGIPVIMIIENNYYKYSWLEKFIPIYEPKDFANIDWNPSVVTIPEEEKNLMLEIAEERIRQTYHKYEKICTLSEKRENINIKRFNDIFYGSYAIEYVKNNWKKDTAINYAFWGATQTAVKLNEYIAENYPNTKLVKVFDWSIRNPIEFDDGCFVPEPLENMENKENEHLFIFVTGNSASQAAKELFAKLNKSRDEYFLCERKILQESDVSKDDER